MRTSIHYLVIIITACLLPRMQSPFHCIPLWFTNFSCARCGACYVGETARHFSMTVREHLFSDCNSHIYKHLKDSESCRYLCSEACFSILDSAPTVFQLKVKEALHVEWEWSSLNKQLKHLNLTLLL